MARVIGEHIAERVPYLGRRLELPYVIAIDEERAGPTHHRVQALREADAEGPDSRIERLRALRLDEEMKVISLDRIVGDAHLARPAKSAQRRGDDVPGAPGAKVPDVVANAPGEMHGI